MYSDNRILQRTAYNKIKIRYVTVASLGGTGPGDTLQGVTPERKKFVGKFTKNSGETKSDR